MTTNPGSIIGGGIQPAQRNRMGSIGGPQIGNMGLQGQLGNYMNLINKGMYGDQQRASYMGGYSPSMFGSFQPQSAGKQWGFAGNLPNYSPAIGLNNLGYKAGLQDTNAPGAAPFQATAPGFSRAFVPNRNEAQQAAVFAPGNTPKMNNYTVATPIRSGALGELAGNSSIGLFGQMGNNLGNTQFGTYNPTFQGPIGGFGGPTGGFGGFSNTGNVAPNTAGSLWGAKGIMASGTTDLSRANEFRNKRR